MSPAQSAIKTESYAVTTNSPGTPNADTTLTTASATTSTTSATIVQKPEEGLIDTFGRKATDLRISVTDRCNLRCEYCLPEEHTDWIHRDNILTVDEYARLMRIALNLGVTEVRITGGEPLLRPDLADIISAIRTEFYRADIPPRIAMTTNAIGLDKRLDSLIQAGLQRINVSLDSLDSERYASLAKRDRLSAVLTTLMELKDSPLSPIKINTVVVDWQSLEEVPDLIRFSLRNGFQWRAIEYMPIGPLAQTAQTRPTAGHIMEKIREHFDITPIPTRTGAPAKRWRVASSHTHPTDNSTATLPAHNASQLTTTSDTTHPDGIIGVIASMTSPFCAECDRTRISADGKVFSCLFSLVNTDLRSALRSNESDDAIAQLWKDAMFAKPKGHNVLAPMPSSATMSQIGG